MQHIILPLLAAVILTGCGRNQPIPSSRLQQPAGNFSFVTPDGWARTKLAGIDFIIVSTDPDFGATPNIFVDFIESTTNLNQLADGVTQRNAKAQRSYKVDHRTTFSTTAGLAGLKITAHRKNETALPVATFHYLIQDTDRVIALTATCAAAVKQKYEPLFDTAMHSLLSDRSP
jgi:hypothetical protein